MTYSMEKGIMPFLMRNEGFIIMNKMKRTICLCGIVTILSASMIGCAGGDGTDTIESSSSIVETEESTTIPEESIEETETETEIETEENIYKDPTASITIEEKEAILAQYEWLGVVHNTPGTLNIRLEPSTTSFIMGKAYENAAVHIVEQVGDWYKIKEHGAVGYVHKNYIVTGDVAREIAMENMTQRAVVNTETLNIRKGPSTHTNVVGRVYSQGSYRVLEEYDNWIKIKIGANTEGFVHADYVDIIIGLDTPMISDDYSNLSQTRRNLIGMAWKHLGGRYIWGGTNLGVGVDCSGFMLRLYEKQGVKLERTARYQALMGRQVSIQDMKPGDLVFFYIDKDYISHVGMYVGDGKMIHAASAERGIRIDAYNYQPVAWVRNLLGD